DPVAWALPPPRERRIRLLMEARVNVLNVVVCVDFREESIHFGFRSGVLDRHWVLRTPTDANRRDGPVARGERFTHRVEVGRLGIEAKPTFAIALEILRARFDRRFFDIDLARRSRVDEAHMLEVPRHRTGRSELPFAKQDADRRRRAVLV